MREKYEQELRVAQLRGVLSQPEAESLINEGLRQGCHPLELLVARGVLSEETLAEIRAAAYGTGAPLHAGLKQGETLSFRRPPAEPPARVEEPLTPGSPTRTIQPGAQPAATPAKLPDAPVTPGSPTLTVHHTPSQTTPYPHEPAFPVPGWERYQPVRFLGQGGMGRVYLAYDPLLRRNVALKFVRGDDPELIHRFVSEAQAQARVEHERVCKVYEVGEVQGQPFIAMQYVEGRSLLDLIRELSLEQKVMVMQQVTEGVHAAHRAGLIHRDIKPTNILVERGEDGRWKPYVMDFGLARDWQREATVTGTVLGTPHYMAPEQARGEVSQLDRRADVYSLGATLYVMLTGKTPIPGTNAMEVLTNLATMEARPLREHDKNVPADLEAIVLKCLEREPSARYDSARALAEDLGRFLNGEPVHARAVGIGYRLRKKARKHRVLVSVVSVALVLVLLALGQAAVTKYNAAERERLVGYYTAQAGDIASLARFIALSPLHDTTADRKALRAQLAEIEQRMQADGEAALGPGHYALGQGWLDLGDPLKAREHLELAWQYGFDRPRTAAVLALALSQLYNEQLQDLHSVRGSASEKLLSEQREARRSELVRLYRNPAIRWIREGQSAPVPPPEYMQALLAFYEERYEDALTHLNVLGERMPWFYEAPMLRGDIFQTRARTRWDEGTRTQEKRTQVEADLEEARKAYTLAVDTAKSAPGAHYGLARVEWAAVAMNLFVQGDVKPHIERALEHVANALHVAPDHAASKSLQAMLYRNLAKAHDLKGAGAVEEPLRKAIASAQEALVLDPSNLVARKELGMDWWELASYQLGRQMDPRETLRHAAEAFEAIPEDKRDYYVHHGLGLIFMKWADYEDNTDLNSLHSRGKAIEAIRRSVQLDKDFAAGWLNLALQYSKRATNPLNSTPEEDLDRAWEVLEKGRALDPKHLVAATNAAKIQLLRTRLLRDKGVDERPMAAAVLDECTQGLESNPTAHVLHNLMGQARMEQARGAWERGEDPFPLLKQAQASFEQVGVLAPQANLADLNLSQAYLSEAEYLYASAREAGPSARAALHAAQAAEKKVPNDSLALVNQGHASLILAKAALKAQQDPRPLLETALKTLQRALELSPSDVELWLYLAETRSVQAQWHARQGREADKDFSEAAQAYERMLSLRKESVDSQLAFGRFCYAWAAWRHQAGLDPSAPLERGLELVGKVLAVRPTWAEAGALRAGLEVLRLKSRPGAAPQLDQALQELRGALEANPHLQHTWGEVLRQAR